MARKKRKSAKKGRSAAAIVWHWNHNHLIGILLGISVVLTIFVGGVVYLYISLNIPDISSIESYRPSLTTVIYDDRDRPLSTLYRQNRYMVRIADMPDLLPKAFVSAEDARFYEHSGVDAWSILRALVHNLKAGGRGQGGSTITQQVARSLLLTREKTYTRKVKEAILAYKIDKVLRKDEILQVYLNEIYLGEGAYGVGAAARVYFDKPVDKLTLAEISILAGLPQAPSRYSPFKQYKLAKKRQAYTLNRMAEDGYITPTAARKAYKQPLLWAPPVRRSNANNYFLQYVRKYIRKKYGADMLYSGGLQVYTTLDGDLQKQAVEAVSNGIKAWRKRHGSSTAEPQAALLAMALGSGEIKAMVGGSDFKKSQFNRAIQAKRQPGSAFKPIIYAEALRQGFTPSTIIVDSPLRLRGSSSRDIWEPQNFSGRFYGPTTLQECLVFSRNIPTIKLLQEVGVDKVTRLAVKMGIRSYLNDNLSLALGASEVSLEELTSAYSVFGRGGAFMQPLFIRKIVKDNGAVLEKNESRPQKCLDSRTAYQITHILQSVIREGTGKKAAGLPMAAAGKTGTTDSNMDAWFIGYTPKLAAGVWFGFDQKKSLGKRETGGRTAAPVWREFMQRARGYYAGEGFAMPDGVVLKPVAPENGHILHQAALNVFWAAFKEENAPEVPLVIGEGVAVD